jgi:hypothetical protein
VKVNPTQIKQELWRRGELAWLLYPHQLPIYRKIREVLASDDPGMTSYVIDCARQFGKSFTELVVCNEECIRNPGSTQVFVAPMKSQANEIIFGNTMNIILADCPPELKPRIGDSAIEYPNGSRIRIAGTDNRNYENLRGGAAHNIFLDEAGFMSNLSDGVLGVVTPMTKTTGGKIIYSSTPPESLDHDYYDILRYHDEAGLISTYTIWDDRTLTERQLQTIINSCRGRDTVKFKREFECMRIADVNKQVVPGFSQESAITLENYKDDFYSHWHRYVVADWGGRDRTALIFAHYNFHTRQVVIEDSLDFEGVQVVPRTIATELRDRVNTLWENRGTIHYICDSNNPILQQDMNITYRLNFLPTSKGSLAQMVQQVRDWVADGRVAFANTTGAQHVIGSMSSAHWNRNRDSFAQSKIYGHYDHTAAMVYLIRNVDEHTDPVPILRNYDPFTQFNEHVLRPESIHAHQSLNQIFKRRQ